MWGRAGARRGAAQGCSVGLRRGGGGSVCTLGGGGLWAGGWVRVRGGRGCGELSRRASPCGRPGGGAAGARQSRPGSPGRSRCRGGRGQRWGPHPARRGRIPPSIIHGGESWWRRGGGATPSPRGRTGSGRAPPEGYRGGGRGWAPGLRGPGPWWLWAGAGHTGAVQGRSSVGLRRGTSWAWVGAQRGAARGCSVGPRRGAAVWGGAGAQQCGAAQGRSAGLRRGAAAWGCAGARHGAVKGRCSVGLRRGAAWG